MSNDRQSPQEWVAARAAADPEYGRMLMEDAVLYAEQQDGEDTADHVHRADGGIFHCIGCGVRLTARGGKWTEAR